MFAAAGTWEFYRLAQAQGHRPFARTGIVLAACVPLAVHAHYLRLFTVPNTAGVLVVLALLALAVWRRGVDGRPLLAVATTVLGIAYAAIPISYAYGLRYFEYVVGRPGGTATLMLPVLCTWASDVGAYAAGRTMGRRKLIPSVSPGKTLEGAIGALIAAGLLAAVYEVLVLEPYAQLGFRPGVAIAFGVLVSVVAQLGDTVESLLKRDAGVKDSSQLIPGHGGVLDRVDSLLFVLPVAYLLLGSLVVPVLGR